MPIFDRQLRVVCSRASLLRVLVKPHASGRSVGRSVGRYECKCLVRKNATGWPSQCNFPPGRILGRQGVDVAEHLGAAVSQLLEVLFEVSAGRAGCRNAARLVSTSQVHHIDKTRRGVFIDTQIGEIEQIAVGQL